MKECQKRRAKEKKMGKGCTNFVIRKPPDEREQQYHNSYSRIYIQTQILRFFMLVLTQKHESEQRMRERERERERQ